MRVLMISDVFFPRVNGVSTSIQTFRHDLAAHGCDTWLVAPEYPERWQDDERVRGICVLSVDPERARELYSTDPAVRKGRLAIQVATWLVPTGGASFPGVRLPASMAEAIGSD